MKVNGSVVLITGASSGIGRALALAFDHAGARVAMAARRRAMLEQNAESMTGWTRSIQAEWAGSGIVVSEYFPGYIKTDSPAESAYGAVEQDALMDRHRNALTRFLTRPKTPEEVALQMLRLVEKPRALVCSGFLVRLGTFMANFDGTRRSIAGAMAESIRSRLGLSQFSGE